MARDNVGGRKKNIVMEITTPPPPQLTAQLLDGRRRDIVDASSAGRRERGDGSPAKREW